MSSFYSLLSHSPSPPSGARSAQPARVGEVQVAPKSMHCCCCCYWGAAAFTQRRKLRRPADAAATVGSSPATYFTSAQIWHQSLLPLTAACWNGSKLCESSNFILMCLASDPLTRIACPCARLEAFVRGSVDRVAAAETSGRAAGPTSDLPAAAAAAA